MSCLWRRLIPLLVLLIFCQSVGAQAPSTVAPALQSELSQHGVALKPDVFAPTAGVFTNTSDFLRSTEYAKVMNNLQMLSRGIWTSKSIGFTAGSALGSKIRGFGVHSSETYGDECVVFYGANAKVVSPTTGVVSGSALSTSLSATALASTTSYSSSLFLYCDGSMKPQKWDGNPAGSFANLTGWDPTINGVTYTAPQFVEVFANRAVFAGMSAKPYTVVLSKQNDPTSYTVTSPTAATDAGTFDVPTRLGPIQGLRTLRLSTDATSELLVIGCARGMAVITGSSATTFALKILTNEYGVRGNNTWIQLGNDLIFLATDGVRRFSQLEQLGDLRNSSLTFPVQDLINLIPTDSNGNNAFAKHHSSTQEILFYVPVSGGSTPSKCIILNYNLPQNDGSIAPAVFALSTKDGFNATAGLTYGGSMLHGDDSGNVFVDYSGNTYNGSGISWEYLSALIGANSPAQSASVKKFAILTDGGDQKFTAKAYTLDTLGSNITEWKLRETRTISITSSTITKTGTWATGTTTNYPKIIDFAPKGSGRYWALQLTGSATTDGIDLVGVQSILTVGGLKQ